jgi:hypothetical protein
MIYSIFHTPGRIATSSDMAYAILLAAGNKAGTSEKRFYKRLIARADKRFDVHLAQRKAEGK